MSTRSTSKPDAIQTSWTADLTAAAGQIPIPGGAAALATAIGHRHPKTMRMHPAAAPLDFETQPIPWYPQAHAAIDSSIRLSRTLAYAGGDYYLQDGGSLLALAAAFCKRSPTNVPSSDAARLDGMLVCDLCAAPGGKASALLEAIGSSGFLLANEPIRSRTASLKYNLARTGSDRYAISSLDPAALVKKLGGVFDLVLVDAPCSGQALVGRGKQTAAAMSHKQILHSAARQQRILDSAVGLLRPGGRLIYSTCTFATAENESQLERLIAASILEPSPVAELTGYQTHPACYRLWPQSDPCAGAFAASMSRRDHDLTDPVSLSSKRGSKKTRVSAGQLPRDWDHWYQECVPDRYDMQIRGNVLLGYVADAPGWLHHVAIAGPELAYRTGQTWKPSHGSALRRGAAGIAKHSVALDDQQARTYLAGETIPSTKIGWQVATHHGRPLGWIKADRRVGKNHLPAAIRW